MTRIQTGNGNDNRRFLRLRSGQALRLCCSQSAVSNFAQDDRLELVGWAISLGAYVSEHFAGG
jgi:hypothetical protein